MGVFYKSGKFQPPPQEAESFDVFDAIKDLDVEMREHQEMEAGFHGSDHDEDGENEKLIEEISMLEAMENLEDAGFEDDSAAIWGETTVSGKVFKRSRPELTSGPQESSELQENLERVLEHHGIAVHTFPETHAERTRRTEDRYVVCAERTWRRCIRETDVAHPDDLNPMAFAAWLVTLRPGWSKATWRQYKSACIYWLRAERGDPESLKAADFLERHNSSVCQGVPGRTSSTRLKNVTESVFISFLASLDEAPSGYRTFAALTKTWLMLASVTGLRPHEWSQAEFLGVLPLDSPWIARERLKPGKAYLRVKNSKHTNGRAHGEFRHLDVTDLGEAVCGSIAALVRYMTADPTLETYRRAYENCSRFLLDANKHFFGEGEPRIHLYTARHRFASEAKKRWRPVDVAAAMGHGNDHTAYSMYGNARFSSGRRIARPTESEANKIRQTSKSKDFLGSANEVVNQTQPVQDDE